LLSSVRLVHDLYRTLKYPDDHKPWSPDRSLHQ
jgi:hypothetical protein